MGVHGREYTVPAAASAYLFTRCIYVRMYTAPFYCWNGRVNSCWSGPCHSLAIMRHKYKVDMMSYFM